MSKKIAVIFGKMNPTAAEKNSINHMSRTTTIYYVLQRYRNTQISKRFWWAGADHANYISLSTDITNAFNQITQAAISETMTSQFGLGIHALVFKMCHVVTYPAPKLTLLDFADWDG